VIFLKAIISVDFAMSDAMSALPPKASAKATCPPVATCQKRT